MQVTRSGSCRRRRPGPRPLWGTLPWFPHRPSADGTPLRYGGRGAASGATRTSCHTILSLVLAPARGAGDGFPKELFQFAGTDIEKAAKGILEKLPAPLGFRHPHPQAAANPGHSSPECDQTRALATTAFFCFLPLRLFGPGLEPFPEVALLPLEDLRLALHDLLSLLSLHRGHLKAVGRDAAEVEGG